VSRKFVYQQTHKARAVLDDAFSHAVPDSEALFELTVTKALLRQMIVGLTLICRGSYRGVVEFLRDLLLVWTAPGGIGCARMRSVLISDKGDRPWTRLAELGWIRRSMFSSCTG